MNGRESVTGDVPAKIGQWSLVRHPLTWILLAYTALGLGLLAPYQFQINPDGIAYLDIAEKYARGDVWGAVNAYWSPLISWLTAGLRLLGLPPQVAIKLVLLTGGAVALGGVWRLLGTVPCGCGRWRPPGQFRSRCTTPCT
ncbi:hypothetical protein [Chloracidobacterium thermophilum]|uniref:hypothetical protein n=1 Tax=Chloracidobacterium thermophilum TaxID=458033 RepID=UPI001BB2DDE0|nr:hypothetical protein [Chloracidobacterium thermophilum]QUV78790.1 hypothetical protein J8C08_00395 [Chloracidobacterium thermophilum]